jgi:type III secretory pathway component EscR
MVEAIPKWVMQRYSALYKKFKMKQFTREEAREALSQFEIDNEEKLTNTFFSDLHKKGWVEVKQDESDGRRKLFKLVPPEKAILNLDLKN